MAESYTMPESVRDFGRGPAQPFCEKVDHGETWRIDRLKDTGHGFVVNRPSLAFLQDLYQGGQHPVTPPDEQQLLQRRGCLHLARKIASLTTARGPTLDIGSGDGGFSYHLWRQGFSPNVLLDPNPDGEWALKVMPEAKFYNCDFEALPESGPFDGIVMSQVLEHALDPGDWLQRAAGLLSENGVLAIAVPNFGGVYHLLGGRDPFIVPPRHLNYFTTQSLRYGLKAFGLELVAMHSGSRISAADKQHRRSSRRRWMFKAWNAVSSPMAWTTRGIILNAYAVRNTL